MMDKFIIISALVSFTVFIPMHVFYLQRGNPNEVFGRLFVAFGLSGCVPFIFGILAYFLKIMPEYSILLIEICAVISWIFYSFFSLLYILILFGLMESSVRIRVLSEVYHGGNKGKTREEILKKYNKYSIIQKRLERFLVSGEVMKQRGFYVRRKKFTPYTFPDLFVRLIWKIYGGMEKASG